ncbi:DUF916 and DUF3324 domain-containing protein [Enterococcus mundtii]
MIKLSLSKMMKRYSSIILVLLIILLSSIEVRADESNLNFYVTPELPESQVSKENNYFDLNLNPGNTEKLILELQNTNSEQIRVKITPHTAYTNVHGVVEYGKDAKDKDPTLTHVIEDLIDPVEEIILEGNETKKIELVLHMPNEKFQGLLAGGLRISEVKDEKEVDNKSAEGVAIRNEFSYVIGVVVSNSRDSIKPELELIDVYPDQLNYRNVISASIQNIMPAFVNRLSVEATVQKSGESEILYEASEEQMQMAPNSNFSFPISLEGDRFQSGEYVLKLKATSGEEEWSWERTFTIDADEARELNRADVTIDSTLNLWMIGSIVLVILLLGVILYLLIQKQKKKAAEQDQ